MPRAQADRYVSRTGVGGGGVGGPQGRACLVPSPLFSSSLLPSGQVSDSAVQEVFWRSSIKWPL